MFGYVTISPNGLDMERQARYRSFYCGLCHSIGKRYGELEKVTLSYDLTFLAVLLQSLYEEREDGAKALCLPHPFHPHAYLSGPVIDYCADMNLLLAYHKALDDIQDEGKKFAYLEEKLLHKAYRKIFSLYPETCLKVEECLHLMGSEEGKQSPSLDRLINLSGDMLGAVYAYKQDYWSEAVISVGKGLGRFIYLMDAYEDLPEDLQKHRFNPLTELSKEEGYEEFIKKSLTMLIAEATQSFEILPLEKDLDIIRNVLYAGCWNKYEAIYRKRNPALPAEKTKE